MERERVIMENPYYRLVEIVTSGEEFSQTIFEVRSVLDKKVKHNSFYIHLAEKFYKMESELMWLAEQEPKIIETSSKRNIECKIVHIQDLPLEEVVMFMDYVSFIIVMDDIPIAGYSTLDEAQEQFIPIIEEHKYYM